MAGEGSSSVGKCPAYLDRNAADCDDLVATSLEFLAALNTQSRPSSTSEGKYKKKKESGHERNPNHPPKEYEHFLGKWSWSTTTRKLQVPYSERS
jgi:hypothetical protein